MEKTYTCCFCGARVFLLENQEIPSECPHCKTKGSLSFDSIIENEEKVKVDLVNHPPHYQSNDGIEVIDVIRAFTKDLAGIQAVSAGNVIKYICRWKNKDGLRDLKKARWYLNCLIEEVEKMQTKESCQ